MSEDKSSMAEASPASITRTDGNSSRWSMAAERALNMKLSSHLEEDSKDIIGISEDTLKNEERRSMGSSTKTARRRSSQKLLEDINQST